MSESSVTIRTATVDDAAALIEFLRLFQQEKHSGVFVPVGGLPTLEQETSWIRELLNHETSNLWLGCAEQHIVGILDFHGHPHPQMSHGGSLGTSVLRAYRGQGVGYRLMQTLIEWATAHTALRRIELEVFSHNTHAISFYERQGFVREGARMGAVLVDGKSCDMVLMARLV